jgi:hypothetical protein
MTAKEKGQCATLKKCPKCQEKLFESIPLGTDLHVFKCQSCSQYWADDDAGGLITLDKVPPHRTPFGQGNRIDGRFSPTLEN